MPVPSRPRSSASEIPSDPIVSDYDDEDRDVQGRSPTSPDGSDKVPSNNVSRNAKNRPGPEKDKVGRRTSNSKSAVTNRIENKVRSPSGDVEMASVEGDENEDDVEDLGDSEPTGSSGPSDGIASVIDLDEPQSRATNRSRPMTRSQARASKPVESGAAKSLPAQPSSSEESPANQRSSSESDFSPVPTRRPRRVAAVKATLKFSNDERADKALSKLLERAQSDSDYTSILAKWRDPGSRAQLVANMADSSGSSEEAPAQRKRLTKFETKSSLKNDAESLSSREDPAEPNSTRNSLAKGANKSTAITDLLLKLRSNRPKSVPLRRNGGTLQDRLRNRPGSTTRSAQVSSTFSARSNLSKRPARPAKSTRLAKRARRSKRHVTDDSDFDEESSDGNSALLKELKDADNELDFNADADEEEDLQSRDEMDQGEAEGNERNSSGSGNSDDQDVFNVDEDESEDVEILPVARTRKVRNTRSAKNSKGRRRRTAPSDVFSTGKSELTEVEKKERLEFLLNQSSEIARSLHQALAQAPARQLDRNASQSRTPNGNTNGKELAGGDDEQNSTSKLESSAEEEFVPPNGRGCELQPHQSEGVSWLLKLDAQGLNAILADEMGLGKTIQAVAFLASLILSGSRGPHLIIAPKNVCEHWISEVAQWYPSQMTVVSHIGPAEERIENLRRVLLDDNFDIMVTSFETALRDLFSPIRHDSLTSSQRKVLREFREVEFEYLVVDEAHRLKSDKARMNQAIRNYTKCQRRLLLTGTPLSNNLQELWSLMNILNPRIFSSKATFESWFSAPFENAKGKKREVMTNAEKSLIVDRLHTVLRPFFRRRERKDVCPDFTSADEVVISCPLSALQKSLMHHFQRRASEREAGVSNILMAMRGVSNHPYTTTDAFNEYAESDATPKLVATSGKFSFLHYALPRLIGSGHRILLFSQFRAVLDYLEDLLELLDIKYGRLDGATKSDERTSGISEFNAEGSDIPVFLLTTRAGGVGLNLQTADTVILFDSDWNPSADLQAVSRIQRIGQKRTVHILRLVSENSIDALIVETAGHKRRTQEVAVGAGNFHTSSGAARDQKLRQKDLEELLGVLEGRKYLDDPIPENEGSGSDTVSPSTDGSRESKDVRIANWHKKLLRSGETELSPCDVDHIWIDSTPDTGFSNVPKWLSKDADLVAAARAMRSHNSYQAVMTYDEVVQSRARVGEYSKKERATRARRHIVLEYSDFDSEEGEVEAESVSDGSVKINDSDSSDSDDSVEIIEGTEDLGSKHKAKKVSKVAKWAANFDASPEDVSGGPSVQRDRVQEIQSGQPKSYEPIANVPNESSEPVNAAVNEQSGSLREKTLPTTCSIDDDDFMEDITNLCSPELQCVPAPGPSTASAVSRTEKKEADSSHNILHEKITLYQRSQTPNYSKAQRPTSRLKCVKTLPASLQPLSALSESKTPMQNGQDLLRNSPIVKPKIPTPPQTVTLPMIQTSGEVKTITVNVQLEEELYRKAQRLSTEAVRRAISGDQASACIICSEVSELLGQHDQYRIPSPQLTAPLDGQNLGSISLMKKSSALPMHRHAPGLDSEKSDVDFRIASNSEHLSVPTRTPPLPSTTQLSWSGLDLLDALRPSSYFRSKCQSSLQNGIANQPKLNAFNLNLTPHIPSVKNQQQSLIEQEKACGKTLFSGPQLTKPRPVIAPLLNGVGYKRSIGSQLEFGYVNSSRRPQLVLPALHHMTFPDSINNTVARNPQCQPLQPLPLLPLEPPITHGQPSSTITANSKEDCATQPHTKPTSYHVSSVPSSSHVEVPRILPQHSLKPGPPLIHKNDFGATGKGKDLLIQGAEIPKEKILLNPIIPIQPPASTAPRSSVENPSIGASSSPIPKKKELSTAAVAAGPNLTSASKQRRHMPMQNSSSTADDVHLKCVSLKDVFCSSRTGNVADEKAKAVPVQSGVRQGTIVKDDQRRDPFAHLIKKSVATDPKEAERLAMWNRRDRYKIHRRRCSVVIDLTDSNKEKKKNNIKIARTRIVPLSVRAAQRRQSIPDFTPRREIGKIMNNEKLNEQSSKEKISNSPNQSLTGREDEPKKVPKLAVGLDKESPQTKGSLVAEKFISNRFLGKNPSQAALTNSGQFQENTTSSEVTSNFMKREGGSTGISRRQTLVRAAVLNGAKLTDSNEPKLAEARDDVDSGNAPTRSLRIRDTKSGTVSRNNVVTLIGTEHVAKEKCCADAEASNTTARNNGSVDIDGKNNNSSALVSDDKRDGTEAKFVPDLFARLQSITGVSDTDLLLDALFASDGDLDSAVKLVQVHNS